MNVAEEHAMIETLVLKEIYEEIESLPRQCKAVFKLIFSHDMSNAQVATKLNIPVKAVLKYKQQAFTLLNFTVLKQCLISIPELTSFCLERRPGLLTLTSYGTVTGGASAIILIQQEC